MVSKLDISCCSFFCRYCWVSQWFSLMIPIFMNNAPNISGLRSIFYKTWIRFSHIFATCNNVPRRLYIKSSVDHQLHWVKTSAWFPSWWHIYLAPSSVEVRPAHLICIQRLMSCIWVQLVRVPGLWPLWKSGICVRDLCALWSAVTCNVLPSFWRHSILLCEFFHASWRCILARACPTNLTTDVVTIMLGIAFYPFQVILQLMMYNIAEHLLKLCWW